MRRSLVLALALLSARSAAADDAKLIGAQGAHANTVAAAIVGNQLYTVDKTNRLFVTSLETGEKKRFGRADFRNTRFLLSGAREVLVVDSTGQMYGVDGRGEKEAAGKPDAWADAIAVTSESGTFYGIDAQGKLFEVSRWGERSPKEKKGLQHARLLYYRLSTFWVIDAAGTIYTFGHDDEPRQLGAAGVATGAVAIAAFGGMVYFAKDDGLLYGMNGDTGYTKQIGKTSPPFEFFWSQDWRKLSGMDRAGSLFEMAAVAIETSGPPPPSVPHVVWLKEPTKPRPKAKAEEEEERVSYDTVCLLCNGTGTLKLKEKYYTLETHVGNGVVHVDTYVDQGQERCWRCRGTGMIHY